ncbi:MAG: amidohydrolase family protein, partial [Gemmatimonadota bacterium]|nr:amidohydrolase family protein [Gemmatimonadota bacterium]
MNPIRPVLFAAVVTFGAAPFLEAQSVTVLRAARVIDGRGQSFVNADVVVQDGKIVRVGPRGGVPAGARLIDLGSRTLLPGLIDGHSHLTWYFNRQGRFHTAR